METELTFCDCTASLHDNILCVQNTKISRTWQLSDRGIFPVALAHASGDTLLTEEAEPDASMIPVILDGTMPSAVLLEGGEDNDYGFAKKHLCASLFMIYTGFTVKLEVRIYPELPVIRTRVFLKGTKGLPLKETVALDTIPMRDKHCTWENISFRAVTDSHNNLVHTEKGLFYLNESRKLSGNLLKIHRTLQNDGVVLIKEAPTADEQVRYPGYDFSIHDKTSTTLTTGLSESDLHEDEFIPVYGCAIGLYQGGDEAFYRLLRDYHEARHAFNRERDAKMLSNTWGDGSQGTNISEQFLEEELDAAHAVGITHYQVDAGWDSGEKEEGTDRCKWEINRKTLPYSFERLLKKANSYGMVLGLWFVPACEDGQDYSTYVRDAQTLTRLWCEHGIRFFKLDGFKLLTYTTTWRFEKMMQLVLRGTGSDIFFDIDITNWPRTGFLGATQYASLFLENRYTDHLSYYPHYTLKNLSELCRYFPSYRIECEFLNVERNRQKYGDDDRLSPARCGESYALALTLFACPLAFLELTGLTAQSSAAVKQILEAVRPMQAEILSSMVLPIGDTPDGAGYAGFQAIRDDKRGYLLILKGCTDEAGHKFAMHTHSFGPQTNFQRIIADCMCEVQAVNETTLSIAMDGQFRYAIYAYSL